MRAYGYWYRDSREDLRRDISYKRVSLRSIAEAKAKRAKARRESKKIILAHLKESR